MAPVPASNSDNRAATPLTANDVPSYTTASEPRRASSYLSGPPSKTSVDVLRAGAPWPIAQQGAVPEHGTSTVSNQTSRSVEGVIAGIRDESVTVECSTPNGPVEISLPPSLIPDSLLKYGQPVSISLDETSGYRRPVITERRIERLPTFLGQEAIDDWIKSL